MSTFKSGLPRLLAVLSTCLVMVNDCPADDIRVGPRQSLRTIHEGLEAATDGDRIVVEAGIYREPTIVVSRSVQITGEPGAILDGEGDRALMLVTASGVRVTGLLFRNVGVSYVEDRAAIKVDEGHDCEIVGNTFENTFFAIYLSKTAGCLVADNEIRGTGTRQTASGNGIHAWYCRNIRILNNRIDGQRDGIYFEFVEDAEIVGNVSTRNLRYGLHFMFSDRCRYVGNEFRENAAGVAVMYTDNVEMTGNTFERNWGSAAYGLLLKDIDDSKVVSNRFVENTIGIHAEGANRVQVRDNDFVQNGWAVKLMANAVDNRFTSNNFRGNTFDVSTNSTRNFSRFDQNFWDRYRGYDLDRDGTGDVPFRPVRMFSIIVEKQKPALILIRSFLVDVLDTVERILPVLTPETLVDESPRMRPIVRGSVAIPTRADATPSAESVQRR